MPSSQPNTSVRGTDNERPRRCSRPKAGSATPLARRRAMESFFSNRLEAAGESAEKVRVDAEAAAARGAAAAAAEEAAAEAEAARRIAAAEAALEALEEVLQSMYEPSGRRRALTEGSTPRHKAQKILKENFWALSVNEELPQEAIRLRNMVCLSGSDPSSSSGSSGGGPVCSDNAPPLPQTSYNFSSIALATPWSTLWSPPCHLSHSCAFQIPLSVGAPVWRGRLFSLVCCCCSVPIGPVGCLNRWAAHPLQRPAGRPWGTGGPCRGCIRMGGEGGQ